MWGRLRAAFPSVLAAILMPDHGHVIHPRTNRVRVSTLLARFSQRFRLGPGYWAPVPEPEVIPNRLHLLRQVRYVALNPCRDKLCRDPLAWLWSTHRDVMGAVTDPWVTPGALAAALGDPASGFARRHHAYVSADPSVHVEGTPSPRPAAPRELPELGLGVLRRAASAACRGEAGRAERRIFVRLALHQGWNDFAVLGRALGVSYEAARTLASRARGDDIAAAILCLGDSRLLEGMQAKDLKKDKQPELLGQI